MTDKKETKRRSISKAKLYVVIGEALDEYSIDNNESIHLLLEALKESIVIDATK